MGLLLSPFEFIGKVIFGLLALVVYPIMWLYRFGDWAWWDLWRNRW